jgi:hypothetical protein
MDSATDRLIHGRFVVGHNDGLTAIATRFDFAAFVIVTGFVAGRVAEVHIDPPNAIAEPVQGSLHEGFYFV